MELIEAYRTFRYEGGINKMNYLVTMTSALTSTLIKFPSESTLLKETSEKDD